MRRLVIFTVFVLANSCFIAQQQAAAPSFAAEAKTFVEVAPWETKWNETLAAAKKEGTVSLYAIWPPPVRTALTPAFGQKFGINLEFTSFGRSAELVAKAGTENRAGLYFADLFATGKGPLVVQLKGAGILGPIEESLILPEVTNPRSWIGGKFPFVDKDKRVITMVGARTGCIIYNTDLVKKGEIGDFKDLLKPQYKGKIIMDDPTVPGAANTLLSNLAIDVWNLDETKEFLRQLVRQQAVVIQRDQRMLVEYVARGKFAIGFSPPSEVLPEFINAGAPLAVVKGPVLSGGSGNIAVPSRFAHPNAAAVFINWLLSKEGQTLFSRSYETPSLRVDVPTEGINDIFLWQPDEKLLPQTEEHLFFYDKMPGISKQVIEEATK
jgi:iron(III) transport system substrate-binding protein